jgi:hypothetical protein
MSRQKHVFNSREVAHIWASQSQGNGRNAQGNFYFEGPSIFSYGSHFEIARILNKHTVLFTTRTYSVTTAKHISYARYAVSHMQVFYVDSFSDHNRNVRWVEQNIVKGLNDLLKSRTRINFKLQEVRRKIDLLDAYKDRFKKELFLESKKIVRYWKKKVLIKPDILAKLQATEAKINIGLEAKRERENLKRAQYYAKQREIEKAYLHWKEEIDRLNINAWKNGNELNSRILTYDLPVALRLSDPVTIETSQGAFVPVADARLLYGMIKAGESIQGFKIGSYEVSGIHDGKLIIGCHKIPLREVLSMAKKLGLEKEVTL